MIGLRFLDVLPRNDSPLLLPLLIVTVTIWTCLFTIIGIMFGSMVADTLDAQELATGRRQEGVFSAALSFSGKATSGLGVLLGGLLLDYVIRFPSGATPATVDSGTVALLGAIAGIALPLLLLFPFLLILRYRITREAHAEIRRQLDERKRGSSTLEILCSRASRTAEASGIELDVLAQEIEGDGGQFARDDHMSGGCRDPSSE